MGRNICRCPAPPGGTVECPENYMPFCIVKKNAEPRHLCLPPFQNGNSTQIVNRILSVITGERKFLLSPITNQELNILQNGSFEMGEISVTFTLTPQVKDAVSEIRNNRGGMNRGFERELESS
jgi:hypothetical protein